MRNLKPVLLALAATALIAGVGCGSSGGGSSSDQLSKEEYASQVKAILQPLGSDLQSVGDTVRQSGSAQELSDNVKTAEDRIQAAVDQLEALNPPSEAQGANDALVSALNVFNDALKKLSDAAGSNDTQEILKTATALPAAVTTLQSQLNEVKKKLEDAGISVSG
jgi:uncharacterized protein YukE